MSNILHTVEETCNIFHRTINQYSKWSKKYRVNTVCDFPHLVTPNLSSYSVTCYYLDKNKVHKGLSLCVLFLYLT